MILRLLTNIAAICGLLLGASCLVAQEPEPLDVAGMTAELKRLESICTRLKLADEQQLVQQWQVSDETDAHILYLPVPVDPLVDRKLDKSPQAGAAHGNWLKAFTSARLRHAQYWYEQAKAHSAAGDEWKAYLALWRVAREDATHAETKRALGPMLAGLSVKGKLRSTNAAHSQFGWEGGSYVRMETANFKVTSHCDAKTTQAIAQKLETFYVLWTQAFYPLWAPPNVTTSRLAGKNTSWGKRNQINVVLCKDRQDYLETLGAGEANIGASVGYYSPESQMSFFYPDPSLDATLYHELTHQLLAEASQLKSVGKSGKGEGFWLVEAIALYMESLVDCDQHWRLGGWLAPRLQAARYRAVHDGFWIAPEKLQSLTLETWKAEPELAQLYTHSAGLAHFFLDKRLKPSAGELSPPADDENAIAGLEHLDQYDADKSRAAFFRAVVAVYQGQAVHDELWELLGSQAQRSYLHAILIRDRHLHSVVSHTYPLDRSQDLVLSRSLLNADSWQTVGRFRSLQWLDLSFSNATSANLNWLAEMKQLERLSLEGLPIDASVLKQLTQLSELKELDLAGCSVDDALLQQLGTMSSLETLWLGGTQVSAASRQWLISQPKLKQVGLEQTKFGAEEARELARELSQR